VYPATTGAALAPLPRKLVGSWTTEQWLDQSGSQKIVRRYVFSPEGHYSYTIAQCQSSTDCVFVAQESGDAQATHGLLAVEPRTASQDGPRSWPYTVDRDPVVGDVRLVLALAGGQTDIFYRD